MADVRREALVICLVESSISLLREWNDIVHSYISSLLHRIAPDPALWPDRLPVGFISYSDSYVHPNPILARRFFSSFRQITAEVMENPASIGRSASSGHRGMAVLEGYAAVIEMFDAFSETRPSLRPQSTNEARPDAPLNEPILYLIHVASSPPNDAMKPSWNTDPALDDVSWDSLPSELLKRKIRLNMILTRPIPKLLDLHKHLSRLPDPSGLTLLKPSHRLLFSGLPPKETKLVPQKRAATENAENPHQPRPSPLEQAANLAPSTAAVPVTPTASAGTTNSSPSHPGNVTSGPSNQPQPEPQAQLQQPQSQSQQSQPQPSQLQSQPQPQAQPQPLAQSQPPPHTQQHPQSSQPRSLAALGQNIDFPRLGQFIRTLQSDCRARIAALNQARTEGKPQAEVDVMQAELNQKLTTHARMMEVYQLKPSGGVASNQGATASNIQPAGNTPSQQTRPTQEQSDASMTASKPAPSGQGAPLTNPTGPAPNLASRNFLQTMPISSRPGMEAQMQKLLAERTRHTALAAAPQTQHQSPAPVLNPMQPTQADQGMTTNQAVNPTAPAAPNIAITMTPRASYCSLLRRWQGLISWPGPRKEGQLFIALFSNSSDLRCELWPRKLAFQPLRIPWSMLQIQRWKNELNPATALLTATPIPGNVASTNQNNTLFNQLKEYVVQKNILACCKLDIPGGPPGAGFIIFPMNNAQNPQNDALVALVFHMSAMPAALFAPALPTQVPSKPVPSTEGISTSMSQAMNIGAGPNPLQNLPLETKAYLQQRQAAALTAYNQQQLAQQQGQQKGLITNSVMPTGQKPGGTYNVAQFLQGMQGMQQQTDGGNQMGSGGSNLPQTPALQQVQHRQPSGFNPGQGGSLQMLQYHMNRRPEDGQGQ